MTRRAFCRGGRVPKASHRSGSAEARRPSKEASPLDRGEDATNETKSSKPTAGMVDSPSMTGNIGVVAGFAAEPVSPQTITTWCARIASAMSPRFAADRQFLRNVPAAFPSPPARIPACQRRRCAIRTGTACRARRARPCRAGRILEPLEDARAERRRAQHAAIDASRSLAPSGVRYGSRNSGVESSGKLAAVRRQPRPAI